MQVSPLHLILLYSGQSYVLHEEDIHDIILVVVDSDSSKPNMISFTLDDAVEIW